MGIILPLPHGRDNRKPGSVRREVAGRVAFLAAERDGYITGATFQVDLPGRGRLRPGGDANRSQRFLRRSRLSLESERRTMRSSLCFSSVILSLAAAACGAATATPPVAAGAPATVRHSIHAEQAEFWMSLQALCNRSFAGEVLQAPAGDTTFVDRELVMHVRECSEHEIKIPFHVGEDRSRTWVLTRTNAGLRLKHDHRHRDGSEDEITQYGGDTATPGTARQQEFPADAHTASLIPAAATNLWTVEVHPGEAFVYALRREGTDRRFRIRFDLTRPVAPPPAPWGHR
jgi:hypothetical protein